MCIESDSKLSEAEEAAINKYFQYYEYAISINTSMRGKGVIDPRYSSEVMRDSAIILDAIKNKGLTLKEDIIVYRAMSESFDNSDSALRLCRKVPAGAPTRCLISAASTLAATKFGGGAYVYHMVVPRGERCIRRATSSIGVGKWYEYILPPGDIVYYGNYSNVPDKSTPVIYVNVNEGRLGVEECKRLLQMVGMRDFSPPPPEPTPDVAPGLPAVRSITLPLLGKIPVLLDNSVGGRFMLFHWGLEQTFADETIRIFDVRRGQALLK
ncbi:hypothetical protein [Xanthomonas maliensis]|uniref:hypothetical protein n=1 Tax=Xanthomonas maliensis TaxID=1321368 RepID=UPI001263FDA4|nr:hypothetical protein [Xanthomonas maliensis]KAB7762107.1 hypothetical protein CKY51_22030 [Xanthomonas maliensis]